MSPEEFGHVPLFQTEKAIEEGCDDQVLRGWLHLWLTVPAVFEVHAPGRDREWRGQNLRETLVDTGIIVKRTVKQRVEDVAGFRKELHVEGGKGEASSKQIADLYSKNMVYAQSTEIVSAAFVDSACTVDRRILSDPIGSTVMTFCDEYFTKMKEHPFESIYTLQGICDRAKGPDRLMWILQGLVDHYRMGFINKSSFAVNAIRDAKNSYCNVLNLKMDAKAYLLGDWLSHCHYHRHHRHHHHSHHHFPIMFPSLSHYVTSCSYHVFNMFASSHKNKSVASKKENASNAAIS